MLSIAVSIAVSIAIRMEGSQWTWMPGVTDRLGLLGRAGHGTRGYQASALLALLPKGLW